MKVDRGCVDMKGTFFIKDSSERRKLADSHHSCGKFLLLKDFIGLILKGKNHMMPNNEFFVLILIWLFDSSFLLKKLFAVIFVQCSCFFY